MTEARAFEQMSSFRLPSPMEELHDDRLKGRGVRLLVKRDDLIHPDLPGNKWRKLKYNLTAAAQQGHDTLLTFGGAYSNHIRATAAAGIHFGFATIGMIRGEEHLPLNPVLTSAVEHGMRLAYLDRSTYRAKHESFVLEQLRREWGRFYLLPEGGSNELAVQGCAEFAAEILDQVPDTDIVCCPVGTGGTLAGIASGLGSSRQAIGFAALKGAEFLNDEVDRLQRQTSGTSSNNWSIELGFHFGGYARRRPELDAFAADFAARHGMVLDWIYVAKMMFGVFELVADGRLPAGSTVVAVITG
jgi:1-aminocyclopropane-1-carboxylate deaminase